MSFYKKSEIPEELIDYFEPAELGAESTPEEYVAKMVELFHEVKRIMADDGVLFLNLGDSYMSGGGASRHQGYSDPKYANGRNGNFIEPQAFKHPTIKPKDLVGIPWMVAFALRGDGWYLRQDCIWHKPNPMPESVTDRCTKSHEYMFLLTKSQTYYFDFEAIREESNGKWNSSKGFNKDGQSVRNIEGRIGNRENKVNSGRNKRSVWTVNTKPNKEAHFATYPEELILPCVKTSKPKAVILDPFMGSGTTAIVAEKYGRQWLGLELNPDYCEIAAKRIKKASEQFGLFEGNK